MASTPTRDFHQYDYSEIKDSADCIAIAKELGLTIADGRTAATWRGGTNPSSVAINREGWHDFSTEESGSVIDLVARVMFSGMIPQAQNWLGKRFNLTPRSGIRPSVEKSRYDHLIEDGYTETARYRYTDAQGDPVQFVIRMEHPTQPKEFLQCDAAGRWTVKHVEPVLYNLPAVTASPWVAIVEGEKDAETLIKWGIPATTNAGGSKKWRDTFSASLSGKDIILLPDNDPVGQAHMDIIGKSLEGKAKSIRIITLSQLPKGDVTDWRGREGGTLDQLIDLFRTAPEWKNPGVDKLAIAAAKEANAKPFTNFHAEKVKEGNQKPKIVKSPRLMEAMIQDTFTRFLNFPRKLGEDLFDHDRDTSRIEYLIKPNSLTAWMQLKSKNSVHWSPGEGFVTKEEFFEAITARAHRYEGVSTVPDWPRRDDVYYAHPELPTPTTGHTALEGLLNFFNPATPESRILLASLFAAPIWFKRGLPRPLWIIDSEDGAGTGKTTIAEAVAELYGAAPVQTKPSLLKLKMEEIIKSLVSASGRTKRVFLLDNVTGSFASPELATLVTCTDITGRAPYGRGEDTRPNNLTYIVTANSATVDNDLAVRSYHIFVKRGNISPIWKQSLMDYIRIHRLQIFADILDRLNTHRQFNIPVRTRFPEFEAMILQAMCESPEQATRVLDEINRSREDSNVEDEKGQLAEELLRDKLINVAKIPDPYHRRIFIHSNIVDSWLSEEMEVPPGAVVQALRNLSKNGLLPIIYAKTKRYPNTNPRSGIMWLPSKFDGITPHQLPPATVVSGNPSRPNVDLK